MKIKNKKVLMGLSGGVDSAVATLLLKKDGYEVTGAFMKNFSETKNKITGECNWVEEKKEAQKIAAILNIKFITLNFEKEYLKKVIDPMFEAYSKGFTPNPDALCNKIIKFPLLWEKAKSLKYGYIATGHYIKKIKTKDGLAIKIPKDKAKDQSYFLFELTQKDLEHTLFPLGDLKKEKVRKIAKKNKFPNYQKKGTSGICFVGKINMKSFLKQKIKQKKGNIKNPEGEIIGKHDGIMFYTIGERIGERLGFGIGKKFRNKYGEKLYVVKKDIEKNILVVAEKEHEAHLRSNFFIKNINLIDKKEKFPLEKIKIRIRHLGEFHFANICKKNKKYEVKLKKPMKDIAEGQSVVIYQKEKILGGGEIRFA
ncbi:TPA: tRNA 2-thiouridine(34) synthase MnmA [Candidatus Pacearchaeota archaeon]|nr:tRNA 2-thiouridine(34) synthase MnmA [Candidatus Pacearchaeota archaeon]